MTDETLKPCFICGGKMAIGDPSEDYIYCVENDCLANISTRDFKSAYCWKELSKRDKVIKELMETMERISGQYVTIANAPFIEHIVLMAQKTFSHAKEVLK